MTTKIIFIIVIWSIAGILYWRKRQSQKTNKQIEKAYLEKDYDEVCRICAQTIQEKCDYTFVYTLWIYALRDLGKYEEASNKCREAIDCIPKNYVSGIYFIWGSMYVSLKQYENAISIFHEGLESDSQNTSILFNLGASLIETQRYKDAIETYRKTSEIEPHEAEVYVNWGYALSLLDESDEAIRMYKKAIDIDPQNINAHEHLSLYLKKLEQH